MQQQGWNRLVELGHVWHHRERRRHDADGTDRGRLGDWVGKEKELGRSHAEG